jgi:hypothetical protein
MQLEKNTDMFTLHMVAPVLICKYIAVSLSERSKGTNNATGLHQKSFKFQH